MLLIGILLALFFRSIFIVLGAAAISRYSWVFYFFGAFLIYTAWKLASHGEDDDDDFKENVVLRLVGASCRRRTTTTASGCAPTVDGVRLFTPMLVVMVAIGTTDVLFALDSIPAIFGLTKEPYLVFTANAFALMGLMQLYFLLGGLLDRLVYLSIGLAVDPRVHRGQADPRGAAHQHACRSSTAVNPSSGLQRSRSACRSG